MVAKREVQRCVVCRDEISELANMQLQESVSVRCQEYGAAIASAPPGSALTQLIRIGFPANDDTQQVQSYRKGLRPAARTHTIPVQVAGAQR